MLPSRVRQGKGQLEAGPGGEGLTSVCVSPQRLLFAFLNFIFKSLNRFRAGKGGRLQVPQVK